MLTPFAFAGPGLSILSVRHLAVHGRAAVGCDLAARSDRIRVSRVGAPETNDFGTEPPPRRPIVGADR